MANPLCHQCAEGPWQTEDPGCYSSTPCTASTYPSTFLSFPLPAPSNRLPLTTATMSETCGSPSKEWMFSTFGATMAGGMAGGLYPTDTPETAAFKVAHSGAPTSAAMMPRRKRERRNPGKCPLSTAAGRRIKTRGLPK